jgi:hypothetical protein
MSGSSWRAWVDDENLPHVEWQASVWPCVPLAKRRGDLFVFNLMKQMVCARRAKDYEQSDLVRGHLLDDGADVTIDQTGVIRVNY